jgi:hypothetical protein
MSQFTDAQVEAALRAWWNLEPGSTMPWEGVEEPIPGGVTFHESSMRDMRAALEAAQAAGEREYDPNVAPCDDAEFGMKP